MAHVLPPPGYWPGGISQTMSQGHQVRVVVIWRGGYSIAAQSIAEYVTHRIFGPVTFSRGRAVDTVSIGNLVAGECFFTLDNRSGDYAQHNQSSPLWNPRTGSDVAAGRYVGIDFYFPDDDPTVVGQWSRMWTGIVTEVKARLGPGRMPLVDVSASGPFWYYGNQEVEINDETLRTFGDLARQVVEWTYGDTLEARLEDDPVHKVIGQFQGETAWPGEVTGYKFPRGTGMAALGNLEMRQGAGPLIETKDGKIEATSGPPGPAVVTMFNDTNGYDTSVTPPVPFDLQLEAPGYTILQVEDADEVNGEPLIYNCYEFSMATNSALLEYPADVAAGGVVVGRWTPPAPTSSNVLEYNQWTEFAEFIFNPSDDFVDVVFQHQRTRWTLAGSSSGDYNPNPLAPSISVTQSTAFSFPVVRRVQASVNWEERNLKMKSRLQRSSLEPLVGYWPLLVEFYGIRRYRPEVDADAFFCQELPSVIALYGRRTFPFNPRFRSDAEAEEWVNKMAGRYANSYLRLTLSVIPRTKAQTSACARIDLGETVHLRLGVKSGLWLDTSTKAVVQRIEWEMDENHIWRVHFDVIDQKFYEQTTVVFGGVGEGFTS